LSLKTSKRTSWNLCKYSATKRNKKPIINNLRKDHSWLIFISSRSKEKNLKSKLKLFKIKMSNQVHLQFKKSPKKSLNKEQWTFKIYSDKIILLMSHNFVLIWETGDKRSCRTFLLNQKHIIFMIHILHQRKNLIQLVEIQVQILAIVALKKINRLVRVKVKKMKIKVRKIITLLLIHLQVNILYMKCIINRRTHKMKTVCQVLNDKKMKMILVLVKMMKNNRYL
jgi:hypothetical protein